MHVIKNTASRLLFGFLIVGVAALSGCSTAKETLNIGGAGKSNPGPCPRAFALYDAVRVVEFRGDGTETFTNVGFTGEINKVRSLCRYYEDQPIEADLTLDFALGRGPMATEDEAHYEFFVAVTRLNVDVIARETFPLHVSFPPGKDRVHVSQTLEDIIIPRANEDTSGANFEIIVGFEVTPEQRQFNADGKRFRVSAGKK